MAPKKVLTALFIVAALAMIACVLTLELAVFWWVLLVLVASMLPLTGTLWSDSMAPSHPQGPLLTPYGGPPHTAWFWYPGVGCSGPMTAKQYLPDLIQTGYGYVASNPGDIGYPGSSFNMKATVDATIEKIKVETPKRLFLYGGSQGGCVDIEVIREVRRLGLVPDEHIHPILDCTPTRGSDVRFPVSLIPYVHGRWVCWFYGHVAAPFFILISKKQKLGPGTDMEAFRANDTLRKTMDGGAQLMQAASIGLMKPVRPGEFAGIKALIISTKGKDALIKRKARKRMKLGFPDAEMVEIEDDSHAAVLELFSVRRKVYSDFVRSCKSVLA